MGRLAHGLLQHIEGIAALPGMAKTTAPFTHSGAAVTDVDTKRAEGARLARRSSRCGLIQTPAVGLQAAGIVDAGQGMAGGRGDDLAGAAPSRAKRSDLQAGQFVQRDRRSRAA